MASAFVCDDGRNAPACKACSALIYVAPGTRGRRPHYCATGCRPAKGPPRTLLTDRDCAVCGIRFKPLNSRVTCCGTACANAKAHQTRSARSAERNRRTCQQCAALFMPTRNSKGLYCSRACQANGIRKYSSPQQAKRAERERWKERTGWQPRPKAPPKPALIHQPRPCKGCAAPFVPHHGSAGFCSAACKRSASNRSRKVYGNKARKRARYHGVAYEPVNRLKLFERDRWRCQVCGVKTPQRLMGTYEPNAPEMDHRIPMAMGGPHTWANVQCACRRCNLAKGGTIIAGQLPLFADVR